MSDDDRTDLEALERAGWDSLCDGTGGTFYGELMTSTYVRRERDWRLALYTQTPIPG